MNNDYFHERSRSEPVLEENGYAFNDRSYKSNKSFVEKFKNFISFSTKSSKYKRNETKQLQPLNGDDYRSSQSTLNKSFKNDGAKLKKLEWKIIPITKIALKKSEKDKIPLKMEAKPPLPNSRRHQIHNNDLPLNPNGYLHNIKSCDNNNVNDDKYSKPKFNSWQSTSVGTDNNSLLEGFKNIASQNVGTIGNGHEKLIPMYKSFVITATPLHVTSHRNNIYQTFGNNNNNIFQTPRNHILVEDWDEDQTTLNFGISNIFRNKINMKNFKSVRKHNMIFDRSTKIKQDKLKRQQENSVRRRLFEDATNFNTLKIDNDGYDVSLGIKPLCDVDINILSNNFSEYI
ncbi:hypothetical protein HELRODRAFT_163359 [Helobdella robusta]|uniref:Uncharacterized protein n=1 Tax=Helobdella robusta TaxID=6412 RepID=T1ETY1_HELRO|nr:hypothetical protein HELRODRAFT_163359 [Helobdella robusta]ESN96310.1 hypothetical protein HELRODRAFT_163359 [Helobdella robusta]